MPSGMTVTPATGCFVTSDAQQRSAGGQLEQPSEVKSSTTTGTLAGDGLRGCGTSANRTTARTVRIISTSRIRDSTVLFASMSIVTLISSPTTGAASTMRLY